MEQMQLWAPGEVYRQLDGIVPVLASWNKSTDKDQQKLRQYLDKLMVDLGPLPADEANLFLHMDIAVEPKHYLHDQDLDNYLYPVAKKLGAEHFVLVTGRKHIGGQSRLIVGQAEPGEAVAENQGWVHVTFDSPRMSTDAKDSAWKVGVREQLLALRPAQLEAGPVEVHLAWRYAAQQRWAELWKPTIDAMGPVVGEPHPPPPFSPDDGRIVSLGMHFTRDDTRWWGLPIGMYWRPLPK